VVKRSRATRRAVALLDAVVAAVILGVGLSALVGLASRAIGQQAEGERLATAAMLADEQLNLVLVRGPDNYAQRFPLQGQCDPPFEQYGYQLQIAGGSSSTPYQVAVTITWLSAGQTKSATVSTLIAARAGDDPDPPREPESAVDRSQGVPGAAPPAGGAP
jgi:hypothetical protein